MTGNLIRAALLAVACYSPALAAGARHFQTPLAFEPNQGQARADVRFLTRGAGYSLYLADGRIQLRLEARGGGADIVTMELAGATLNAEASGRNRLPGVVNYLIGNSQAEWRTGVPTFGEVRFASVYPGIDLVFYGNGRELEYDFVVAPGADPDNIRWRVDGARAALDRAGNIVLRAQHEAVTLKRPVVYQRGAQGKTRVDGAFALRGGEIRFRLGRYDASKELVIDPVLSFASYLSGKATDHIGIATGPGNLQVGVSQALAIDGAGSAYVTGYTYSLDFPAKGALQSAPPTKQQGVTPGQWPTAFVSKFSPDGTALVYSTYLGGNGSDYGHAIAVDSLGNAYIAGQTNSNNFPVSAGAYQTVCSPAPGNSATPTASCNSSNTSAFVTKLNATGSAIVFSTFFGGYGWANATSIAIDASNRVYIAGNEQQMCSSGFTYPACFPTTTGAVITSEKAGGNSPQYAYLAAFNSTGTQLLYSTLFGDLNGMVAGKASGSTTGTVVTVDANGNVYLGGETQAGKLPTTTGVIQPTAAPLDSTGSFLQSYRGFLAKFNAGTPLTLAYATYLGGQTQSVSDYVSGIAVDTAGNAIVAGYTNSRDFPITSGVYGTACGTGGGTCSAAHITKLNASASAIVWSTYVGGAKPDGSDAMTFTGPVQLDGKGNIYLIGQAGSGFPLVNATEAAASGGAQELLLVQLDANAARLVFSTRIGSRGKDTSAPAGLAVDAAGNIFVAGNNLGPNLITTPGAYQTTAFDSQCCYHGFVAKIEPSAVPTLQAGTLANGATYLAGGLVPGSWAQVKGTNLSTVTRIWDGPDFVGLGNALPTTLSGVQVKVNDKAAAVYFISPTQISFQVPAGITGTASVQVIANGQTSNTVTAEASQSAPGIFPVSVNGVNYPAAVFLDGKLAGDPGISTAFRKAVPGETVQMFATGLAVSPAGTLVSMALLGGVTVTVGGVMVPASAAALVAVGEYQVNFVVPQLAPGSYPISISVNGVNSPASINSSPAGPVVLPIGN